MGCEPKSHSSLCSEVVKYCNGAGYVVGSLTYHDCCTEEFTSAIQGCVLPTAMEIRTREDGIAVHRTSKDAFKFDCKTNGGPYRNLALEVMPLYVHLINWESYEDLCLYIYRDDTTTAEGGFWVSQMPPISKIIVPEKWCGTWYEKTAFRFADCIKRIFGYRPSVYQNDNTKGSNDPFAIIKECAIKEHLHPWKDLIRQRSTITHGDRCERCDNWWPDDCTCGK